MPATRTDIQEVSLAGLSSAEVSARHERGQSNRVDLATSRPLSAILRANIFTVFNGILAVAVIAVLAVGDPRDAVFGIVLVLNSLIGIFSELRSKRALDKLAVLTAPTTKVRRDGKDQEIPSEEIVIDDVISLSLGDQVPADGKVLDSRGLSIDESALTGESKPVKKQPGDPLLSGTSVVSGSGAMVAEVIGDESWAQKITKEAKKFSKAHSEIQDSIDKILKWITFFLPIIVVMLLWSQVRTDGGDWRSAVVLSVAGIVGMIPQGLVLLTSLNFGLASASLARKGVLVQELPAVEILARVNVLCLDKTGTLTTGNIRGRELVFEPGSAEGSARQVQARNVLKCMVSDATNESASATMQLVENATAPIVNEDDILRFNSTRKWSALCVHKNSEAFGGEEGTWLFGAPEILLAEGSPENKWAIERIREESGSGRRTIVLAFSERGLEDEQMPANPLAVVIVVLEEDIRPDAKQTLAYFEEQGVRLKVISGDAPETVGAIAREVGLKAADGGAPHVVDARELPHAQSDEFARIALQTDVFGRVTPDQKQALVVALQSDGYTVAMTGDGVNDALALKTADLGIAMGNAAPATKTVARIVLVSGEFSTLPGVVSEGRRIIANMERVSSLFLSKTTYAILLAVLVAIFGWTYPFLPRHLTYISAFTIGVPGFFLSLAPNTRLYRPGFLKRTLLISVPSGIALGLAAIVAFLWTGGGNPAGHTAATIALMVGALWLLVLLSRPWSLWRLLLIVAMAAGAFLGLLIPWTRDFFAFEWPEPQLWTLSLGVGAIASVVIIIAYYVTAKWRTAGKVTSEVAK